MSSSNHYSPAFQITKTKEESKIHDFSTVSFGDYNLPFTLSELQSSLSCAQNTTSGLDQIHNSILKYLPDTVLHFLLSLSLSLSLSTTEFDLNTHFQIASKKSSSLLQNLERIVRYPVATAQSLLPVVFVK